MSIEPGNPRPFLAFPTASTVVVIGAVCARRLISALALSSILRLAGNGHGVVFGRGSSESAAGSLGGGGGFLKRSMIGVMRRSMIYVGSVEGGANFEWLTMAGVDGVDGDGVVYNGRRLSVILS